MKLAVHLRCVSGARAGYTPTDTIQPEQHVVHLFTCHDEALNNNQATSAPQIVAESKMTFLQCAVGICVTKKNPTTLSRCLRQQTI